MLQAFLAVKNAQQEHFIVRNLIRLLVMNVLMDTVVRENIASKKILRDLGVLLTPLMAVINALVPLLIQILVHMLLLTYSVLNVNTITTK